MHVDECEELAGQYHAAIWSGREGARADDVADLAWAEQILDLLSDPNGARDVAGELQHLMGVEVHALRARIARRAA